MSQTYKRRPGEKYAEITEIDFGRFLVDFTERGLELATGENLLFFEETIPFEERPIRFLSRSIDENFLHTAWEQQEHKRHAPATSSNSHKRSDG